MITNTEPRHIALIKATTSELYRSILQTEMESCPKYEYEEDEIEYQLEEIGDRYCWYELDDGTFEADTNCKNAKAYFMPNGMLVVDAYSSQVVFTNDDESCIQSQ